jgi:hypothetical protein
MANDYARSGEARHCRRADRCKGLAFEIADLIVMKGWADFRDLRMVVCLDHGADDEDDEEVVALHATMDSPCLFIMWRNAKSVFVQLGQRSRYGSVAAAIESLSYEVAPKLTDINAPTWPTN